MNYKLSEEHYADLEKKVNSLNRHKKASITLSKIGENYEEVQKDFFVKFIEFDIEVKSDVDNSDIIILAQKKIDGDIVIINKLNEEVEVPESFRNTNAYCSHCNTSRMRKKLYIAYNKSTKEYLQIGNTCLHDFLGMEEGIDGYIQSLKYFDTLIAYIEDTETKEWDDFSRGFFGKNGYAIDLKGYLAFCYEAMKNRNGKYINNKMINVARYDEELYCELRSCFGNNTPKTTKDEGYLLFKEVDFNVERASKENLDFIEKVLEYVKTLETDSNIMLNAKQIIMSESGKISVKYLGYVAFLPNSYIKYQEYLKKKEEYEQRNKETYANEYLGNVKDKFDLDVKLVSKHLLENFRFGNSFILNMVDDKKHLIMWKTKAKEEYYDLQEGQSLHIKGSIKDTTEYRGNKETVVTRCKLEIL